MKIKYFFVFVGGLIALLNGCTPGDLIIPSAHSPTAPTPRENTASIVTLEITPTASQSLMVTSSPNSIPSATQAPPFVSTSTPTGTMIEVNVVDEFPPPALHSEVKQQCLTIEKEIPDGVTLTGVLALNAKTNLNDEDNIYFMTTQGLTTTLLPTSKNRIIDYGLGGYAISPDRKLFAYVETSLSGENGQLHIILANGYEQPIMALWDDSWGRISGWLDNQRLIVRPFAHPTDTKIYGSVIILNPFTGELEKLLPNFSGGLNTIAQIPLVYYNSTLTRAFYLSGDSFFLWDVKEHRDISKKSDINWSVMPEWSPDESQFALVSKEADKKANIDRVDNIFLISQDGEETRLTNLADAYPSMSTIVIEGLDWSPSGRYISFLVRATDDIHKIKGPTLMIVDIYTKQITDYCIVFDRFDATKIVWSPDSNKLAIASPEDYQMYIDTTPGVRKQIAVILIDIVKGLAFQIKNDFIPIGWLASP